MAMLIHAIFEAIKFSSTVAPVFDSQLGQGKVGFPSKSGIAFHLN